MINGKELLTIIISAIILAIAISFIKSLDSFLYALLIIFVIIAINVLTKKLIASNLDSQIEVKFWEMQKYGFKPHEYFKRPIPVGLILPIVVSLVTFGSVYWLGGLVFEVKAKVHRAAKRYGLYSFSEMTENHIGIIAAAGIIANLIFAIVGYLVGIPDFARLSIFFVFFNMIPFSDLDGNKIFFGNLVLWSFLAVVTLIGLGYAFLMV